MKTLTLVILAVVFNNLNGQQLTLADLTALVNKSNWESVNQTLINRGWTFFSSEEETDEDFGKITWSYDLGFDDKAAGWFWLYVRDDKPDRIAYQFHSKALYNSFLKSISAAGYKKASSNIIDDGLVQRYASRNYEVSLVTSTNFDDYITKTAYLVSVQKKSLAQIFLETPKNGVFPEYDDDNNKIAEYTYKNNIRNGPYKLFSNDEVWQKGVYVNGKKNGKYSVYENNRIIQEGLFANDLMNGLTTEYYYDETGILKAKAIGNYVGGLKTGKWNGISIIEGKEIVTQFFTFINDYKNGPFKMITEANEMMVGTFVDDEIHGFVRVYANCFEVEHFPYIDDLKKLCLKEEGTYEKGKKHGKWKIFDSAGKIIEEKRFEYDIEQL